jgi:hypothetical protein
MLLRRQLLYLLLSDLEYRLGQRCSVVGPDAGVGFVNDGRALFEGATVNGL